MKNNISWENGLEPNNYGQHYYIFDKKGEEKSKWMKEKSEIKDDGIFKLYIDIKEDNYFIKIINLIEKYIIENSKYDIYKDEILNFFYAEGLKIHNFIDFTFYLNLLIDEDLIDRVNGIDSTKIVLFIDNCNELNDEEKINLNSLISIREREIIYYLGLKGEETNYVFYTNTPNIIISTGHDYFVSKIDNILKNK